jgi:AraC-like DNA-binding protein
MGWGVNPEPLIRHELTQGTLVDIRPGATLSLPLYWQRWRLSSPTLALLSGEIIAGAVHRAREDPTARPGRTRPVERWRSVQAVLRAQSAPYDPSAAKHARREWCLDTGRSGAARIGLGGGWLSGALDALWPREGAGLLEQLAEQRDDRGRAAVLQVALLQRWQTGDAAAGRTARVAVALIAASEGRRPLRGVAASLGVGERRLQQLFRAQVGLSPRAYGRLARLHGCLRALRSQLHPCWADVAIRSGFYDQAHLVNEFRALCGMTPAEFLGLRGRAGDAASALR